MFDKKYFGFSFFVRNIYAGDLLEYFLISAVSSVLAIRAFLTLTGYPQIGREKLHIAHMLWGGLFMAAALIVVLTFLNKETRIFASIVGGVGFGTFIDELGKFITSDNNYFFEPTISLIYVIFVLLFLLSRSLEKNLTLTDREYTVNAIEFVKEVVLRDLDDNEKKKALALLSKSNIHDPVARSIKEVLRKADALSPPEPNIFIKTQRKINSYVQRLLQRESFSRGMVLVFVIISTVNFFFAIFTITSSLSFAEWGHIFSSLLSSSLVIIGVYFINKSRMFAFEMFKKSLLISIFLTQFFAFYKEQLSAIFGLGFNILILIALEYLIGQERLLLKEKGAL